MSADSKKEWLGESGYCNCVLVSMCRAQVPILNIFSDQSPPRLEELVADIPKTLAWIRSQEFNYSKLNSSVIIQILSQMGGIKKSLLGFRPGEIVAQDCVEENGPIIQRKFRLKMARSKDVLQLSIERA